MVAKTEQKLDKTLTKINRFIWRNGMVIDKRLSHLEGAAQELIKQFNLQQSDLAEIKKLIIRMAKQTKN